MTGISHTTRINTKDANTMALQLLAESLGEHNSRDVRLAICGPAFVSLAILSRCQTNSRIEGLKTHTEIKIIEVNFSTPDS